MWTRLSCRSIRSVIIHRTPAARLSDFVNRPNWTPLSPITITYTRSLKTVLLFFIIFFICTVKVVTNTIHNSTYIHLLTIRHVTEFTFIACMQMLNDYIAYLQYTVLLTWKHHLYDINYLHYVTLDYTIFHYNTLHYLLTYIAYNTLHNLTIRCITYSLYVVIV